MSCDVIVNWYSYMGKSKDRERYDNVKEASGNKQRSVASYDDFHE